MNIRLSPLTAQRLGAKLAEALQLRRSPLHADRWSTAWGTKSDEGLARTVARIVADELILQELREATQGLPETTLADLGDIDSHIGSGRTEAAIVTANGAHARSPWRR